MTSSSVTVKPDITVDDWMRIVTQNRIRHLPVQAFSGPAYECAINFRRFLAIVFSSSSLGVHVMHRSCNSRSGPQTQPASEAPDSQYSYSASPRIWDISPDTTLTSDPKGAETCLGLARWPGLGRFDP